MVTTVTLKKSSRPERPAVRYGVPAVLFGLAALGWWWSLRMADDMRAGGMNGMNMSTDTAMTAGTFLVAWLAMMTAMMLPAIAPVVKLYARAAGQGRVAPFPFFIGSYLAIWTALGVPAYFAWRALDQPLADGATWAARLGGTVFVAAGLWQVTPLKELCLRHCRSPLSFFLRHGRRLERPMGAFRMGAAHGLFCVGCCWAVFALLVAIGTMNIGWMLGLSALITLEKTARAGERIAMLAGVAFFVLGALFLVAPHTMTAIT